LARWRDPWSAASVPLALVQRRLQLPGQEDPAVIEEAGTSIEAAGGVILEPGFHA